MIFIAVLIGLVRAKWPEVSVLRFPWTASQTKNILKYFWDVLKTHPFLTKLPLLVVPVSSGLSSCFLSIWSTLSVRCSVAGGLARVQQVTSTSPPSVSVMLTKGVSTIVSTKRLAVSVTWPFPQTNTPLSLSRAVSNSRVTTLYLELLQWTRGGIHTVHEAWNKF